MKALKVIGIIILIIIILFLVIGIFLPSKVIVEESITINQKPNVVFKQVNNLKNRDVWSAYKEFDTASIITFEGPGLGVGAKYIWTGGTMGDGSLTIVESVPYSKIRSSFDFSEKGGAEEIWTFEEDADGVKVIWQTTIIDLSYPFGRWASLFVNCMMKPIQKKGLENLQNVCEKIIFYPEITEEYFEGQNTLAIKDSAFMQDIQQKFGELYGELMGYIMRYRIQITGQPYAKYYSWEPDKMVVLETGFPVAKKYKGKGRIIATELAQGNVVTSTHYGPYSSSELTYMAIDEYIIEFGKVIDGYPWEVYIIDPSNEPDSSKWETKIYFPVE